tara:strand:+ start:1762 stop:1977 length:216 start_codon:yes stop_codon:yes gene_type:complete
MVILKTFSTAEQAHVIRTVLSNEGIDATVIDDNAFGGNALGAIQSSIRIEVPENQLDQAQEILDRGLPESE